MKKNPSWERSKKASRSAGVLSWVDSGNAVGILVSWPGKVRRRPPPRKEAPRAFSLHHDPPGHGRPVNRTLVRVGSGIPERHRIAVVGAGHYDAVPEDLRRQTRRLDRVRARGVPGPRDALARRDRVHGRVRAAVVGTAEEDIPPRHRADRAPPTAPTTPTAAAAATPEG